MPDKVISLAPHITETLYFLGLDSLLVGVTDFCDYPPQTKNKQKLGGYTNTNYELISAINPDYILLTAEDVSRPQYKALSDLGFKLIANNPRTFDDIIKMIKDYGKLFKVEVKANHLADSLIKIKSDFDSENNLNKNLKENLSLNKTLILISSNPIMTANGQTFINEIIKISGLKNIYEDGNIQYPQISQEDIISKNPDVIIMAGDTANSEKMLDKISELSAKFEGTNAIKNKKIIFVDENLLFRPSPRILEAVGFIKYKLKQ
ncbi:MAG TPA: helical backbone metal receptor [Ignavibacteria bacterium]|nr:helical backbone metal receptor [Ignavibacteria bacterium]